MPQREERVGRARRHEGKLSVVLERGDGNEHAPRSVVIADGDWHGPTAYGEPEHRYQQLGAVHVTVEYDDADHYRIAELYFDDCPRCTKPALVVREWKAGEPRHVHQLISTTTISTGGGTMSIGGVFCDACRSQLGTEEACREALLRG